MRNLNRDQNMEIARILIGAAKAIFIASALALLFPMAGHERPYLYCLLGAGMSIVMVIVGIMMMKGPDADDAGKRRPRR